MSGNSDVYNWSNQYQNNYEREGSRQSSNKNRMNDPNVYQVDQFHRYLQNQKINDIKT